jgi:hypothetical protein
VGIFLGVGLYRGGDATVRVAFTEDGVDGTTKNLLVGGVNGLFGSVGGLSRVAGDVIALGLELLDALNKLGDGGTDVGELDGVGFGFLGENAEVGKVVVHLLGIGEVLREVAQDAGSDGDVTELDRNTAGLGEAVDDGEELHTKNRGEDEN